MELHDKIDQYLLDQLNPADKAKFEQLISSDAKLQNEVSLQESITKVLNQTGATALKGRLDSIPVSMSSTGNAIKLKWLGAGVAATFLAGLIIFLMPSEKQATEQIKPVSQTAMSASGNNQTQVGQAVEQQQAQVVNTTQATQETKKLTQKNTSASASASELEAYNETSDFSEVTNGDISREHQAVNMPSSNLSSENNKLSNLSVTIDNSNPTEKNYQFTGAKLTLFGDFAKHPYELLELNHKGQKALFLSYQNEYYELVWGKSTKTPLNKVNNKQTIEKLKLINN